MVKVPSKIPPLNTLKQCLKFLDWLKNDENMQDKVAGELEKRLKIYYYKDSDAQNIKSALSSFLGQVSHFYNKLCKNAQPANYMANTPTVVLFTLLATIPKVLSVAYVLQYHVDVSFKIAGGGGWEDESVATPGFGVSKIDAYLTSSIFKRHGVIPGGFRKGDIKGGTQGGYTKGREMAADLPKLLEELHQNFFSDVFVISALTTAGSQASNTANALALLKIFCEILGNDNDKVEKALEGNIYGNGNCIDVKELKGYCAELKVSFEKIFNAGILSNTGHSPKHGDLNKEKFAKRMAKWLRDNLDKVRGSLSEIKTDHVPTPVEYFTEHFFPYGFIFDTHDFGKQSHQSEDLRKKWEQVIGMLSKYGGGLDKLVGILKGRKCDETHGHQADTEEVDEEDQDDDVVELVEDGTLVDDASSGSPNQNNGQSEQKPGISQESLGSNVAPEDGKGSPGPAGPLGDKGKSLQDSGPPAQQPVPPQAAAHKSSTTTPSPGHAASGVSDTDSDPGAAGPKGDPGQTGPPVSVVSASSDVSDVQVIQTSQPTLQSSAMSSLTPPDSPPGSPKPTAQTGVLGAGSQDNASLGTQITGSPGAVLTQSAKVSSPPSAASGSVDTSNDQAIPDIESEVINPWEGGEDAYNTHSDALLNDHIERLRDPNGVNLLNDPITHRGTFREADPESDFAYNMDKLREASGLSNSLDLHDADVPFEHFDFHEPPKEGITSEAYIPQCRDPWYVEPSSTSTSHSTTSPSDSDHLPSPNTVREMLYWMVGVVELGYIGFIQKHVDGVLDDINKDSSWPSFAIEVTGDPSQLTASHVTNTLAEACLYSANIITRIKYYNDFTAFSTFDFKSVYSKFRYSPDPACLLCQLRDYAYACHYQLQFLKSQCSRNESRGGWKNCEYGSEAKMPSRLQAFLTDAYDSKFKTHLFDPCNICLKSRVRIGFKKVDLPERSQLGSVISAILSPSCGDDDPLLTLSSNLTCLTRRTPRTTGELVSYFHNFGKSLYDASLKTLSKLGSALTKSHANCPNWDQLGDSDLQAVHGIRGYETLNSKHNHGNDHSNTLSTLVGCSDVHANCPPHCSPITYRAYSLYSPTFAHTYLSWAVYLPDRLWESLERLRYDFKTHTCSEPKSFHQCSAAMPLLYTHGFMPPEGKLQWPLTCSEIIVKLRTVVNGKPIATLMTAMDDFLYRVRMPFIYTLIALWSVAALLLSYTILYRLDILYLCSHAIRSKASHLIDVKALLTKGRTMLSLYDADYFDDDPNDVIDQLK